MRCDFTLASGDVFQQVQLFLTGGASDQLIAQIFALSRLYVVAFELAAFLKQFVLFCGLLVLSHSCISVGTKNREKRDCFSSDKGEMGCMGEDGGAQHMWLPLA